ncbi:MAG TPA: M48 family metallopeptidase [Chthonomonadaceae bacterium]|nr:M48 family metallopeptidase [Chthonomonadaceae bacterium]
MLTCLALPSGARAQTPQGMRATLHPTPYSLHPARGDGGLGQHAALVRRDPYTPHVPPRAIAYQRAGRALGVFAIFWNLLGLWAILQSGLSARLRDVFLRRLRLSPPPPNGPPPFRLVAAYFVAFSLLAQFWFLPLGLARFYLEHHFGFGRQSLGGYFADWAQTWGLELLLIPLIWGGYWLYARTPRRWWLWLWAIMIPLIFFVFVLQPVVIAPLYNRYTPLPQGPLRAEILNLAARAGVEHAQVLVEDTSRRTNHVNAYVYGLGPTARIVINDTSLRLLPQDQILAMVGHELGHYVEKHIWVGFLGSALGAGIFLWLASRIIPWAVRRAPRRWRLLGIGDIVALPLVYLVLSVFLLVQYPLASALSRYLEHRADAFGLRLTHLNDATARLFVGFAERDYSDPNPPALLHFWFGTHPTLSERIAFALHYKD